MQELLSGTRKRELWSIVVVLIFLALSLAVLWSAERLMEEELGETAALAILLIPVVLYLAVSGRVKRIAGGSLDVEFSQLTDISVAGLRVAPSASQIHEVSEMVEKGAYEELPRKLRRIDPSKAIVLTLTVAEGGSYDQHVLSEYLRELSLYPTFLGVIFTDPEQRFLGFIRADEAEKLTSSPEAETFLRAVNEGNVGDLRRFPAVMRFSLPADASDETALHDMSRLNVGLLAVVDKQGQLIGFAEREQVISRMLLALTG